MCPPDPDLADGYLAVALRLIKAPDSTASEIRRSISSAYYAAFHALARTCANSLVGKDPDHRPNKAWVEVYRGLSHGICKQACEKANTVAFPECIQKFADAFKQLQEIRHKADYDPDYSFSRSDAELWYELADISITNLREASENDKKAFSAWVLISSQGAKNARKENMENTRRT